MEKLQRELVEKILLIPAEADNEATGKEALEVINKLKDNINDVDDKQFTALDYVIIADSIGNHPRLSKRQRINNRTLKKLEDAIRDIGGKTSEELGQVQMESRRTVLHFVTRMGSIINIALDRAFSVEDREAPTNLGDVNVQLSTEVRQLT